MKTKLSSVLCVVLMSWSINGYTQTGFGVPDCGLWINGNRQPDKAWLLGFLSGLNTDITNKDFLRKLNSAEQAYLFVDNYCRKNPLKKVSDAGVALFSELYSSK
jgi:hypothetical protein